MSLYSLPTELLASICEYLNDSHWPSLRSLCLVSKRSHSIAVTVLWKTLRLKIIDRQNLEQDIQKLRDMFQFPYICQSVRWVEVTGRMAPQELGQLHENVNGRQFHHEEDFRIKDGLLADNLSPDDALKTEGGWVSLASLIQSLSALSDLVYRCSNQFPRCLLQVLHRHHPGARLHLENFHLRSLSPYDLDAYELEIVSSPCLHAVEMQYDDGDAKPVCMYNRYAVLDIVSKIAPNLREVTLECAFPSFESILRRPSPRDPSTVPWLGLPPFIRKLDQRQGALTKLALSDNARRTANEMKAWAMHTDLSMLQVLRLNNKLEEDLLEWLSEERRFPSLKTFYLHGYASEDDAGSWNYKEPSAKYWLLLASFFETLPPLSNLRLSAGANCRTAFFAALKNHTHSLRSLYLDPYNNAHQNSRRRGEIGPIQVKLIRKLCPLLEDLNIKIRRSKGDLDEISMYETIGTFPRLQKVELALDASVYLHVAEQYDDPYTESITLNQDGMTLDNFWDFDCNIRDALINAALDDDLALSIFRVISQAKSTGNLLLEFLRVRTFNGDKGPPRYPGPDLHNIFIHIGTPRTVTRNIRDDSRDDISVRYNPVRVGCARLEPPPLGEKVLRCFRSLWPTKSGDWREDWFSLPLAKQENEASTSSESIT